MREPYFPLSGTPDCSKCEREGCHSREKFQRNKRSFSYLSGRCPRLKDLYGRMEPEDETLYKTYLANLERGIKHGEAV